MELLWAVGLPLAVAGILVLVALTTRPPRCRARGVPAVAVDEYELSAAPQVTAVTFRCPRCGELALRRAIGFPEA